MQHIFNVSTSKRCLLVDITSQVKSCIKNDKVTSGIANIYVQGATAAIMIQENWDYSVQEDVLSLLEKLIPRGIWKHDVQDGNGDSHLKSGIIGPSECIPIIDRELGLSTWQNIFLCEFDGPRDNRTIVVTIVSI